MLRKNKKKGREYDGEGRVKRDHRGVRKAGTSAE